MSAAFDEFDDPELLGYRRAAAKHAREGELEINHNAVVLKGEDAGAYVMAWLWIDADELAT